MREPARTNERPSPQRTRTWAWPARRAGKKSNERNRLTSRGPARGVWLHILKDVQNLQIHPQMLQLFVCFRSKSDQSLIISQGCQKSRVKYHALDIKHWKSGNKNHLSKKMGGSSNYGKFHKKNVFFLIETFPYMM